jgi:hypothetical protein
MSALTTSILGRTDADLLAWDNYAQSSPLTSGYHQSGWRRIIEEAFGHETYYLAAQEENGSVQGVLPLVLLPSRINCLKPVPSKKPKP